ncbi:MAG: DUF309 domain-containing protein [Gemmataceae bacterium]|nr:DUF309 domain-containing protein [Gemmataceae bacterium]MDW8265197.1 DUF309 domain-containing protein [Gemmataceae bacterium]
MAISSIDYEPRYLAGIVCFNAQEFFEAHEVWEGLWLESAGPERRFVQGLIQAAVALYHLSNGNLKGAGKLFRSARAYMEQYPSPYWGLDVPAFWQQMEECCRPILSQSAPDPLARPDPGPWPIITLQPPPETWPDPHEFLDTED